MCLGPFLSLTATMTRRRQGRMRTQRMSVLTVVYLRRRRAERKAQHQQESDSGDESGEEPLEKP